LIAYVREHTGGYSAAIYGIAIVMVAAIVLPMLVKPARIREQHPAARLVAVNSD
jgi:hypothetical protein